MLIVEGPDGAGKTTLIQSLSKRFDLPVAPRVVSKDAEAMVDLKKWVEENTRKGPQPLIYDRHRLISEPIYGPILRRQQQPGFSDPIWMMVNIWRFYKCQPLIIYCLPSLDTIKQNIEGDLDNKVVWDHIDGIYAAYCARAALDTTLDDHNKMSRVIIYDYQAGASLAIIDQWTETIEGWKNP